jgi:hypothetical protein
MKRTNDEFAIRAGHAAARTVITDGGRGARTSSFAFGTPRNETDRTRATRGNARHPGVAIDGEDLLRIARIVVGKSETSWGRLEPMRSPPVDAVADTRVPGHLGYSLRMTDGLRDGRFVVLEPLGEGAQGQTFDGVDKREGQRVAIKRFDVRGARTWKEMELAEREAQVLQSLTHPKLPRYIDHFEHDGALYLVMEKIEGESLASLRRRGVVFTEADAARFLADAAEVLDYLHRRSPPVIHRDLKPANVIRRPDGSFAFVDFGSVRDKLRPEGGSTVVGTFGYMAPEQFQGRAFPASDVYGIGATALSMLAGAEPETLPHKGLTVDVRAALGDVGDAGDATARPMVRVLERLLDPNPDTRANRIAPLLPELTRGRGARTSRSPPSSRTEAQEAGGSRGAPPFGEARAVDWHGSVFEQQALEFERRADDFDRRAEMGGMGGPAARGLRKAAGRLRREAARMRERAQWFDRHAARREARRARQSGRQDTRIASAVGRAYQGPPWPVRVFLAMLFLVGMIGVWFGTQLIAPFVLRRLAGLFPREARDGLLHAATVVEESGSRAIRSIDRSRRWLLAMGPAASRGALQESGELGESAAPTETRSRVASEAPAAPPRAPATGRARVATESGDAETEAQAHEEEGGGGAVEDAGRKGPA